MIRAADGSIIYRDPPLTWRQRAADAFDAILIAGSIAGFLSMCGVWAVLAGAA